MGKNNVVIKMTIVSLVVFSFLSCNKETSNATGWKYNDPNNGGYLKRPYEEQETGPGLILIEGGRFTMGRIEQDVMFNWDHTPKNVTVSSFYLDETEVTNQFWLDYMHWLERTYGETFPAVVDKALPDENVWREKLGYREDLVEYYFRHPSYREYPVVGVSWLQASDYCEWRTDRVNEGILIREGILNQNIAQVDDDNFNTDSYFAGKYESGKNEKGQLKDIGNAQPNGKKKIKKKSLPTRDVIMEDGILLPKYRLPTEAEWEFAAYALIGNTEGNRITSRRLYPWNGHYVRNDDKKNRGQFMANYMIGTGDYMGIAGALNDKAAPTSPVTAYWPNDYGLYNMAGNVSEWVMDVYRPLSFEDFEDFNPYRGNVYKTKVLNTEGVIDDKLDITMYDVPGIAQYLQDFKTIRSTQSYGKDRDSLDGKLLSDLDSIIETTALKLYNDGRRYEASEQVIEIIETIIPDFIADVQSNEQFELIEFEIVPKLREGFAEYVINNPGNLKIRDVTPEENIDRRNYTEANYIDFEDGDVTSSLQFDNTEIDGKDEDNVVYRSEVLGAQGPISLIHDGSRVFKGGNWQDKTYYLSPGTRRYYDEHRSTAYIGFRCAMTRVGSPVGLGGKKKKKK